MENHAFTFASLFQLTPDVLNALHEKGEAPRLIAPRQEVPSIFKLVFSFIFYIAGSLSIDYGWHHHAIGFFLIGGFMVLSSLVFLLWPFISGQDGLVYRDLRQKDKETRGPLNDFLFISMKM